MNCRVITTIQNNQALYPEAETISPFQDWALVPIVILVTTHALEQALKMALF